MRGQGRAGGDSRRLVGLCGLLVLLAGVLAGCGGGDQPAVSPGPAPVSQMLLPAPPAGAPAVLRVPEDEATIQQAVDASLPGQIISIAPGIYHEAVRVERDHPGITIRGRDRNGVILEGDYSKPDGIEIEANDVVVENMTARQYVGNGFYWDGGNDTAHPLIGYRGSYLTAYSNGDYDIYAFNAQDGQFDHSYASGSPDAGFYIGECYPCNAVIDDVVAEWNALGYSGTNAGGNLIIRDSIWRDNMAGIVPNTMDFEQNPPEHQTTILDNQVYDNNNTQAPARPMEAALFGTGIGLPGGVGNVVYGNQISDQHSYGILVVSSLDANFWLPSENRVIDNTITNSGVADLALAAPSGPGNCFSGNDATTTLPALLQQQDACDSPLAQLEGGDPGVSPLLLAQYLYASNNFQPTSYSAGIVPVPPDQPQMPDAAGPARPIFSDLGLFAVPDAASTRPVARSSLAPFPSDGGSVVRLLFSLYAELLLVALYAAWLALACWNLAYNKRLPPVAQAAWLACIVALPLLGPLAYSLFGRRDMGGKGRRRL